jgi:fumarate hydratase class I
MTVIRQDDFIDSVADALQFISYYHPLDYRPGRAPRLGDGAVNPAAKDAMAQILINSRMCAEGHRPICQDTGIVTVFLKIGMDVRWDAQLSVTRWSTRACAAPTRTRTTCCAPRSSTIPQGHAATPATTRRR